MTRSMWVRKVQYWGVFILHIPGYAVVFNFPSLLQPGRDRNDKEAQDERIKQAVRQSNDRRHGRTR
jgi:hypothetical protein